MDKVCTKCGKELPATKEYFYSDVRYIDKFRGVCRDCTKLMGMKYSDEHRAEKRRYLEDNKERIRVYKCGYRKSHEVVIKKYMKKYRTDNASSIKANISAWNDKVKGIVLSHYGGQCAICGETNPSFLCIDHINNDGAEHRKKVGGGLKFYRWLMRNNFPSGFQVLCWNHNWLKHLRCSNAGVCYTDSMNKSTRSSRNTKLDVVRHYGNRCSCCGESNIDLLTIDHTDGGGCKHLRIIGYNRGTEFYRWIINNNYPDYLQLMCWNCNCGKSVNGGVCPHE